MSPGAGKVHVLIWGDLPNKRPPIYRQHGNGFEPIKELHAGCCGGWRLEGLRLPD